MADFSLTTMFVVPVGSTIASSGSTQNLTAGKLGVFSNAYAVLTSGTIAASPYFYVAQGRTNTYLHATKKSDKIKGCPSGSGCNSNVTEWYKVTGCPTPINQITEISGWNATCGDVITITLRAHSSYIDTLYFNGLTRSVTVVVPCCECGSDPCTVTDVDALIDNAMEQLTGYHVTNGVINWNSPLSSYGPTGINPDHIMLNTFFTFAKSGSGSTAKLLISGKPLTAYGVPCDVAAFPHEFDRMWFRAFVYSGPATTADFIVSDACNIVATATNVQNSNYARGTSDEIKQLEKNFYSYQVGMLKHLDRMAGYNQLFESWVTDGTNYTTYYIKFNNFSKSTGNWGDYISEDSTVIIAVATGSTEATALEAILVAGLGSVSSDTICLTTTSTTTTTTTVAPG